MVVVVEVVVVVVVEEEEQEQQQQHSLVSTGHRGAEEDQQGDAENSVRPVHVEVVGETIV